MCNRGVIDDAFSWCCLAACLSNVIERWWAFSQSAPTPRHLQTAGRCHNVMHKQSHTYSNIRIMLQIAIRAKYLDTDSTCLLIVQPTVGMVSSANASDSNVMLTLPLKRHHGKGGSHSFQTTHKTTNRSYIKTYQQAIRHRGSIVVRQR